MSALNSVSKIKTCMIVIFKNLVFIMRDFKCFLVDTQFSDAGAQHKLQQRERPMKNNLVAIDLSVIYGLLYNLIRILRQVPPDSFFCREDREKSAVSNISSVSWCHCFCLISVLAYWI